MTKKDLLSKMSLKFGQYSLNDFQKKCMECALLYQDFFFDVITGCIDSFYADQHSCDCSLKPFRNNE